MASFTKRVTIKKRYDYLVPAPAHVSEVYKAMNVAEADVDAYTSRQHDGETPEIFVTMDDENVVIYWEHETAGARELNPSERR